MGTFKPFIVKIKMDGELVQELEPGVMLSGIDPSITQQKVGQNISVETLERATRLFYLYQKGAITMTKADLEKLSKTVESHYPVDVDLEVSLAEFNLAGKYITLAANRAIWKLNDKIFLNSLSGETVAKLPSKLRIAEIKKLDMAIRLGQIEVHANPPEEGRDYDVIKKELQLIEREYPKPMIYEGRIFLDQIAKNVVEQLPSLGVEYSVFKMLYRLEKIDKNRATVVEALREKVKEIG